MSYISSMETFFEDNDNPFRIIDEHIPGWVIAESIYNNSLMSEILYQKQIIQSESKWIQVNYANFFIEDLTFLQFCVIYSTVSLSDASSEDIFLDIFQCKHSWRSLQETYEE